MLFVSILGILVFLGGKSSLKNADYVEVSGSWRTLMVDGIYEKNGSHFQHLAGDKFIFEKNNTWRIGTGVNYHSANSWYKSSIKNVSTVPKTNWRIFWNKKENSDGSSVSGLRVEQIRGNVTREMMTFGYPEVKLDNAVICDSAFSSLRLFISFEDPRSCDQRNHCKFREGCNHIVFVFHGVVIHLATLQNPFL